MRTELADGVLHVSCAAIGLASWALARRLGPGRWRRAAFALVFVCGLVSFPGIDRITGEGLLHPSELYHYVIGAKYFPELGYDGLYDATTRATVDLALPQPERVRDLVSNRVGPSSVSRARGDRFQRRFTPDRWLDFELDVAGFDHAFGGIEREAVLDHGFNATPPWVALARPIVGSAPVTRDRLLGLAAIDLGLLVALVLVLVRTFGAEKTALVVLFTGTAYTFRFAWIGGSLLRFDWLLALGLALVALRRQRPLVAGLLLAWATASRLFPACFAAVTGLALLVAAVTRGERRPFGRYLLGYFVGLALAFLLGAATGRGPVAYREFAQRFETHQRTWASNHVGFESVVVAYEIARPPAESPSIDPFEAYAASVERARAARKPLTLLAALAVFVAIGAASRRLRPEQVLPLGAILCFSMSTISGYYWVMLALAPLVAPPRTTALLVACTFLHVAVELVLGEYAAAHGLVSVAFTAIFVDWLIVLVRDAGTREAVPS